MQKPNSFAAKKPAATPPGGAKAEPAAAHKPATAAHVDKHDADTNAKHAQKK